MRFSSRTAGLLPVVLVLGIALPAYALVEHADGLADHRLREAPTIAPASELVAPTEATLRGDQVREFLSAQGGQWRFRFDRRTGRPDLVQGSGIALIPGAGNRLGAEALRGLPQPDGMVTLQTLEPLARGFIDRNETLLRPERGRLELDSELSSIREQGRLASLYFDWFVDGVPVEGAAVYLRLNSGNITQFGAVLVGPLDIETEPALSSEQALARLLEYSGDDELYRLVDEPELLIQPEDDGRDGLRFRLIWKVSYRVPDRTETWEGRLDARTGEVIGFRDSNRYGRAVGGVYPRTVFEGNETRVPMPLAEVSVDGGTVTTDAAGSFIYGGGTATSTLGGHWFNSSCQGCTNPAQPRVGIEVGSGWLDFGLGGTDEVGNGFSTPADRNAFYHLNQVRRVALKWLPGLAFLNQNFRVNVNIVDTCNAFYDGASVNFFRSGGGCNNSGEVSDVMHHEYGHGLDGNTRSGDGSTGEGTADAVAMHLSHSPLIGPGFRTTGSPVRDLRRESIGLYTRSVAQASCDGSVHCEGRVIGQTIWELAQDLTSAYGHHTGWRVSERLFFTSLPDQGSQWADGSWPIYNAYLNADDDDGNLTNGTPNGTLIFNAFSEHEIANSSYPDSPQCTRPDQPVLAVVPQCASFDLSWNAVAGVDHYELLRAEVREDSAFFPVAELAAGQTTYEDPEVAPGVDYWYVVLAVDGSGCESTIENPVAARLVAQPVLDVVAGVDDDTPRGNRSGFADPGEEVDLRLSVANFGEVDGHTDRRDDHLGNPRRDSAR